MLFWVPLVFSLDHRHLSPTTKNLVLNNIRGISFKNPTYGNVLKRNLITEALEFCYLWSSIGRLWSYVKYCDKEKLIYKFWILKKYSQCFHFPNSFTFSDRVFDGCTTVISWVRCGVALVTKFWTYTCKITVLPRATFLVSNGNNMVACNFPHFVSNWPFRNSAGNWDEFQILTNR